MGRSLYGNQNQFELLSKSVKDTVMAMEIPGVGCVVKNTRHKNIELEESMVYVPGVIITEDSYDGKKLAKLVSSGGEKTDFVYTDVTDATVDTEYESNELTYAWSRDAQLATFTQTTETDSGAYSINDGDYVLITAQPTVKLSYGDTVKVKLTSDTSAATAANVTVTMEDATEATYDVTTAV